jgi:Flp pilus assembly protein TadG
MIGRLLRSQVGTAVIEFALTLPLLIMLLIGSIEFGRYEYYAILCAHAARAGLEYGAQNVYTAKNTAGIQNAALQDAQNLGWVVTPSYFCVQNLAVVTCPTTPTVTTYYLQVSVTGTFYSLFHYPWIPSSMQLNSTETMLVASQ